MNERPIVYRACRWKLIQRVEEMRNEIRIELRRLWREPVGYRARSIQWALSFEYLLNRSAQLARIETRLRRP